MSTYIHRMLEDEIYQTLRTRPITGIIGPQQCGKSSIAKIFAIHLRNAFTSIFSTKKILKKLKTTFRQLTSLKIIWMALSSLTKYSFALIFFPL
jgi:predicted AAA+ superfamily ATPase